jgi:ribonuclease P protein component
VTSAPPADARRSSEATLPNAAGPTPAASPTPSGQLQRSDRLQRKSEFDAVFQRGRRAHGPHLSVIATPVREPAAAPRLGLAVAKGVGHAPARARMRRLAREAFRTLRPSLQRPVDLVVSTRQPWPDAQLADVLAELSWLGKKLRLLP